LTFRRSARIGADSAPMPVRPIFQCPPGKAGDEARFGQSNGVFRCRAPKPLRPVRQAMLTREGAVFLPCAAPRYRFSIGLTSRGVLPTKSCRGRPILYSGSAIISFSCAIQPTVRASAKMAVNSDTGMPIAFCTMPE
jgi:hypothetical protein